MLHKMFGEPVQCRCGGWNDYDKVTLCVCCGGDLVDQDVDMSGSSVPYEQLSEEMLFNMEYKNYD